MQRLITTHRTSVTEDQIDHLGHLNVRFYGVHACEAARTFAATCGLAEGDGSRLLFADTYTRLHREQLLGAPLEVRTGVLDATESGLCLFHELANEVTGVAAATFVQQIAVADDRGVRLPLPPGVVAAAGEPVPLPDHARPRSIPLDADLLAGAPTLDEVRRRGLALRQPRTIEAQECDGDGALTDGMEVGLLWGGAPVDGSPYGPLFTGSDGRPLGWATVEHRLVLARRPRVGDKIQSFAAGIGLGDKVSHRMQWAYDLERAEVLCSHAVVNLAFDIEQRRAVAIPDDERARLARLIHPDLAPGHQEQP